jgi:hypothetical protein
VDSLADPKALGSRIPGGNNLQPPVALGDPNPQTALPLHNHLCALCTAIWVHERDHPAPDFGAGIVAGL